MQFIIERRREMRKKEKLTMKITKKGKELKSLELFERELKNNYNPIFNYNKEELTDDRKAELNKNLFR